MNQLRALPVLHSLPGQGIIPRVLCCRHCCSIHDREIQDELFFFLYVRFYKPGCLLSLLSARISPSYFILLFSQTVCPFPPVVKPEPFFRIGTDPFLQTAVNKAGHFQHSFFFGQFGICPKRRLQCDMIMPVSRMMDKKHQNRHFTQTGKMGRPGRCQCGFIPKDPPKFPAFPDPDHRGGQ